MSVLLISYDLNGHERPSAYEDVKDVIEALAEDHRKPLYSQWFVKTDKTVHEWSDLLREVMDKDDKLFIIQVKRPYQGWLKKDLWTWLKENI